jgi:tetratricopeptide (TPR) repeat protein
MRVIGYVYLAGCLFAGTSTTEFNGRLIEGSTATYDGLVVEITNLRDRTIHEHADVSVDGSFSFRAIPEGDYEIRVITLYDNELASTVTSIGPTNSPLEIRMPQAKLQRPTSGTVSIQQLNHPLSKQVRKLLESGQKLIADQNYSSAAARFREAARDAPDCVQAHADLALALSRMQAWDAAAEEYRAAVALDPKSSILHSNLSAALASSKRFDEARSEATAALKLDPRNPRAHFVMAGVLLSNHEPVSRAMPHLVAAQDTIPSAKAAVEKICAAKRIEGCP